MSTAADFVKSKLNATTRDTIVTMIGKILQKNQFKGINHIRGLVRDLLHETKTNQKGKVLTKHKFFTKNLHDQIIALMTNPKDTKNIVVSEAIKNDVSSKLFALSAHLSTVPKRMNSSYMIFSNKYCSSVDMSSVALMDRASKVSAEWKKLSAEQKKAYQPDASVVDAYNTQRAAWLEKLKALKCDTEVVQSAAPTGVAKKPKATKKSAVVGEAAKPSAPKATKGKAAVAEPVTVAVTAQQVAPVKGSPKKGAVVDEPVKASSATPSKKKATKASV